MKIGPRLFQNNLILVNGDARSPQDAARVLDYTSADGIMIGMAAQGNPWLFREISHYLATGELLHGPEPGEIRRVLLSQLENLYAFYGKFTGVRIARKHIRWYGRHQKNIKQFLALVNQTESAIKQLEMVSQFFSQNGMQEMAA